MLSLSPKMKTTQCVIKHIRNTQFYTHYTKKRCLHTNHLVNQWSNQPYTLLHPLYTLQVRTRKWIPFQITRKPKKTPSTNNQLTKTSLTNLRKVEKPNLQEIDSPISLPPPRNVYVSPFQAMQLLYSFSNTALPSSASTVSSSSPSTPTPPSPSSANTSTTSFNLENLIKLYLKLRVDLSRESVRGTLQLPHSIGRDIKLLVFCPDELSAEMIEMGADYAGITTPLEKIGAGKIDFDKCIASPEMMPRVMKVARVLGPLKLMPNPKSGTIVSNFKEAIKSLKLGNMLEYRAEGDGELTINIGRTDLKHEHILENLRVFIQELNKHKPRANNQIGGQSTTTSGFAWPPLRNKSKNSIDMTNINKAKESGFVETCYIKINTSPNIYIDPHLLSPQSLGYHR